MFGALIKRQLAELKMLRFSFGVKRKDRDLSTSEGEHRLEILETKVERPD